MRAKLALLMVLATSPAHAIADGYFLVAASGAGKCQVGELYVFIRGNVVIPVGKENVGRVSGQVASSGAVTVSVQTPDGKLEAVGTLTEDAGSGSWTTGQCSGSWTAVRKSS